MDKISTATVYPWIEPLLKQLQQGDLELCAGKASVKNFLSSSYPSKDNTEPSDIFTVDIPYAGTNLNWQVLFDGNDPDELPDFLIPEHDGFDPDYEDIPHLVKWNARRPDSLLNVVKDLLRLYRQHHLKFLSQTDERLSRNVEEVISSDDYPLVDACVIKEDDRHGVPQHSFSVLIRINLDYSGIPDICFKDAPPEDSSFLLPVLFIRTVAKTGKIVPQLYMPPRVEYVLGGPNIMRLPTYSRQNTVMLDYIQTVHRNLGELVTLLRDGHSKRREYIAAFLYQCADNVIEYDAEEFCKISLLFSHEDFYFIVHVTIAKLFPKEQPLLIFQSMYHVNKKGALYQVEHASYPYSPRWTGSEMVKRTRSYILEKVDVFRTGCLKNGTI